MYPGYVCCAVASLVPGRPVKWIEDRSENLQADSFARDYHMEAKMAADADGKITGLSVKTLSDCGAADAAANPSKFPAGLYSICTGSYDMKAAHVEVDGVYTTKPPGGVAYRCSFRVTEAVHMIERMADIMAHELGQDPADFRLKNFIRPDQFPVQVTDRMGVRQRQLRARRSRRPWSMIDYRALGRSRLEKRARGELMGIGISSFTEVVGAGPSRDYDILGIKMFDSAEIRIHPTGKAMARFGTKSQGQGHETTYAQIVAEELGLPAADVQVEEGDTDTAPYGLGTYASRSTPTAGAAAAMAARKIKAKAKKIAAYLLEVGEDDLEWNVDRFQVKGSPDKHKTIQQIAFAAYTNHPQGMEAGLEATDYYDPPNLTFPFGSYICVVDIDTGTGEIKVRRFVAVDDCGNIINPMIVEGQIEGGLTMGLAPAMFEEIVYDENGQNLTGTFADYLLPTAVESPKWELGKTITPSPHHPDRGQGRRRVAHHRRAARDRQRDRRCAVAPRRAPHRHPHHPAEGLAPSAPARCDRLDRIIPARPSPPRPRRAGAAGRGLVQEASNGAERIVEWHGAEGHRVSGRNCWMISARIETAISAGRARVDGSPTGPWSRSRSASVKPRRLSRSRRDACVFRLPRQPM